MSVTLRGERVNNLPSILCSHTAIFPHLMANNHPEYYQKNKIADTREKTH